MKKLKKFILVILIILLLISIISCASYSKNAYMKSAAGFKPEEHKMWTRPIEFGYEILGDIEGSCTYAKLFLIFTIDGEVPKANVLLLGSITDKQIRNPAVNMAAINAIESIGADGIYVTSVVIKYSGFTPIYLKREVTIKGKGLKLVDMGTVDMERADKERYLLATPEGYGYPEYSGK